LKNITKRANKELEDKTTATPILDLVIAITTKMMRMQKMSLLEKITKQIQIMKLQARHV
jgi:hypothetical protein